MHDCQIALVALRCIRSVATQECIARMQFVLRHLWVQDLVAKKEVATQWVPRNQNPADCLTHQCSRADFAGKLWQIWVHGTGQIP